VTPRPLHPIPITLRRLYDVTGIVVALDKKEVSVTV
jgi:hypothetical protein